MRQIGSILPFGVFFSLFIVFNLLASKLDIFPSKRSVVSVGPKSPNCGCVPMF